MTIIRSRGEKTSLYSDRRQEIKRWNDFQIQFVMRVNPVTEVENIKRKQDQANQSPRDDLHW